MSWLNANDVFVMELVVRERVDDLRASVDRAVAVDDAAEHRTDARRADVESAAEPSGDVPEAIGQTALIPRRPCHCSAAARAAA